MERPLKSGPESRKKRTSGAAEAPTKRKTAALEAEMRRRRDLEIELQDRMAELAEADRRKDEFLATLAHELRNPLAPIKIAAMLARPKCTCGGSHRYLDMIERQADTLTRLVDDLIEVSRLTHGKLTLKRERIPIATIITRAVDSARTMFDQRRHALSVSIPDVPVHVLADPVRLEQAILNLLANAAKYTLPGGNVEIQVEAGPRELEVRVRDDGPGIPREDLDRVFDLFRQVPDRAPGSGGLGIGLTMARALVEMHGGSIHARSEGPGTGSEFVIRLPLAEGTAMSGDAPLPTRGETGVAHLHRVLVVDDNADAGQALQELLRASGHEVRRVRDGRSALRTVREYEPDVVLLDLAMPHMDGYEVARRIRASHPRVRLIAVTGYSQPQHQQRATEAGISELLVKPVRMEALARALGQSPGPRRGDPDPSGGAHRADPRPKATSDLDDLRSEASRSNGRSTRGHAAV
jgi:signal transduction histidine kinase/ActR/RegA family two-component response regulator